MSSEKLRFIPIYLLNPVKRRPSLTILSLTLRVMCIDNIGVAFKWIFGKDILVNQYTFPCLEADSHWSVYININVESSHWKRMKYVTLIRPSFTWFLCVMILSTSIIPRSMSNFLTENAHYSDVIMSTIACLITSLAVVYSTVYSDADQRKHQSSASLAFVRGIHRDRWIPRTKGQLRGKCFHLMTSSWSV